MGIPSDTASRNDFIKEYQDQKYQEEVLLKTCYLFMRPETDSGCSQCTVCVVPGRILDSVNSRKRQHCAGSFYSHLSVHVFHLHLRLKKLAEVLLFLKTASFPFPLFQSAAALFLSHMEIEPGWRQAEEWGGRDGWMGSRSWKIKPLKQNVLNCWLEQLPGNEPGVKPVFINSP